MKLFFFSTILVSVAHAALTPENGVLVSVANADLPADNGQIHCPPGNCEVYTVPYGFNGRQDEFHKCYNSTTDTTIDGIWTGLVRYVNKDPPVPDDYIKPEVCTGSEYSQCDTDDDCSLEIGLRRRRCKCYVSSSFHPFDPCEGLDPSKCNTDQCTNEECSEYEAMCIAGENGAGGTCGIFVKPDATDKIRAKCSSTDQCSARIRLSAPTRRTGVDRCNCYAASSEDRFNECEGDDYSCATSRCSGGACDGLEAYCDIEDNATGQCTLRFTAEAFETANDVSDVSQS